MYTGVLGKPINLELQRLNATHGSVTWDQPPSRVESPSVHYVININGNQITLNLTTYVFIWPVPLGRQIHVCVTAINPVGKGRTSFVNMSLQCDDLSELIKKNFFYRFLPIMRSSEMHATCISCALLYNYIIVV